VHDRHAILSRGTPAAREARQVVKRWYDYITTGEKTFYDLIEAACAADGSGRPLHRLKIHPVLAAQPNCTAQKARAILRKIVALLDMPTGTDIETLTIAWLIDSRSQGRRIAAYLDVTIPLQVPDGFPWSPVPAAAETPHPAPTPLEHTAPPPAPTPRGCPSTHPTPPAPVPPATYDDPWADE
jgi:hypothetical protein